jgi:hypothetical protein
MGENFWMWLIGQGLAIGVAGVTIMLGIHRNLSNRIETYRDEAHHRINDVKDKYVRRDDLDAHLSPIRQQMSGMDAKLDRIIERQQKPQS